MELSEAVKSKSSDAIQLWADETLIGKPEILGYMIFTDVTKFLQDKTDEINSKFKD